MEYRGKHYSIVPGIGPDSWKWTVRLDEKNVKAGQAKSRAAAKALAPKKLIPRPLMAWPDPPSRANANLRSR
jgi:hypothetical protein